MAGFNIASLNPKLKSSSKDYGFLIDQLSIKQNQLESDGKLAPGDYDILISEAQKLLSHPGLTNQQRSDINVKISSFQSDKKKSSLQRYNDIDELNREVRDDYSATGMLYGNNPAILLQARADSLQGKLDRINNSIQNLESSGSDATNHLNEFNATLSEYNDTLQALEDVKNYTPSGQPASSYVAYVTTNNSGEIIDVNVGRVGSKTGYVETNGIYGGMQIYGKINKKENNKNVFLIGSDKFSAPDVMVPDPANPLSMKASMLVSESQKKGANVKVATANQFQDIDLANVRTQNYIRNGGYAQGEKGFIYKKLDNGKFVKYTNADKTKLGITDNDIINIPRSMESGILPSVQETIDSSAQPFEMPLPTSLNFSPGQTMSVPQTQPTAQGQPTSRVPSPVTSSPKGATGYAASTESKAKGLLARLFGK